MDDISVATSRTPIILVVVVSIIGLVFVPMVAMGATTTFTGGELLGKPTDNSITINIVPASTIEYYYEYGTSQGGPYPYSTTPKTAAGGQPDEVVITGLDFNTRYYYRMIYDGDGDVEDGNFEVRDEHTFHTQRAEGEEFVFTITSDSHAIYNTQYQQAMANIETDGPDFHLDLGDTFMADNDTNQSQVNYEYLAQRDSLYMGRIGTSVPIFITPGNHEEEEGWNLDDMPFSIGVGSIQARKAYFPTPINDGFYSGNVDILPEINATTYGNQYREDYYAWEWGDALFVVIDVYQYTLELSYNPAAGEGNDDSVSGDQWSWTLGEEQYNWLKQTLENSHAKYKFVFSHHVTGGITRPIVGVDAGYVRGGAEAAAYFEWGGRNADGSWGFDTMRPGWGVDAEHPDGTPIHQLFLENGVSGYFHGHDHLYAYEIRDGIVYQEVPSPSMTGSGFSGIYTAGVYDDYRTDAIYPNSGHLRITVTPTEATVEYVRSNQPEVSYTYTIAPNESPAECPGDFNSDGTVNEEDLQILAEDVGRTDCSDSDCEADFNPKDNDVDGSDISYFIDIIGTVCP